MPMTKRLGAYKDVHAVFVKASEEGGGSLEFTTPGKAIHFRQRAYYYRRLLGDSFPEFDDFQILCEGTIVILQPVEVVPLFKSPDGKTHKISLEENHILPELDEEDEETIELRRQALMLKTGEKDG